MSNKNLTTNPTTNTNPTFITRKLLKPTHSFDSKLVKKSYTQEIQANKTMHLQKLKLQISMHLTSKIQNQYNKSNTKQKQKQKGERNTTQSQSLNNYTSPNIKKIYRSRNQSKQNMYRQKRQARQSRILAFHARSKKQSDQDLSQIHKKSFLIKQIKPQKKQRFTQDLPICNPIFGRTFGSYYQIVAVQKRFQNSRYFFNQNASSFIGNKSQELEKRYQSRINNPQSKPNKLLYKNPQGSYLQPWKLDDHHNHHLDSFY